mgnify:CR=1 FL=1
MNVGVEGRCYVGLGLRNVLGDTNPPVIFRIGLLYSPSYALDVDALERKWRLTLEQTDKMVALDILKQ